MRRSLHPVRFSRCSPAIFASNLKNGGPARYAGPMARRTVASLLALIGLFGCDARLQLVVQLKTDVRPGYEFTSVSTVVMDASGTVVSRHSVPANTSQAEPYLAGLTVAESEGLAAGTYTVSVGLIDVDGRTMLGRRTRVELRESTVVTVLLTSDCVGVECPIEGDSAELTECLGGRCVTLECVVEDPAACPEPECESDLTCTVGAACAVGACVNGVCFGRADDTLCRAMEYCDTEEGCQAIDPDVLDGGVPDAGACVPGAACTTERACEVGTIECVDGAPVCQPSGVAAAGTECRAEAGECDVAETCDGASPTCPADVLEDVGVTCSAGVCDGLGGCAPCMPGAACSTGNPCERGEISCSGGSASCVVAGPAAAGIECRAAVDGCDVTESCDGSSTACPTDRFAAATVECRVSAGPCDVAERCTGSSPSCPIDGVRSSSTSCRSPAGPCDVAENCDGSSIACPSDGLASSGTSCRAAASVCDVAETCDGTSVACPTDRFALAGGTCRGTAGPCDVAETCNGTSGTCPSDGFASGGVCRGASGACDVAESCNGSGPNCPSNSYATSGVCRGASGACDVAESCNGSGPDCPTNGYASSGVCRGASGSCDVAESCNGSGPNCPADGFRANGSSCGATWSELSCGPVNVDFCQGGSCMHDGNFNGANRPSCGGIGSLCGISPQCCGNGDGYFCVSEGGNPIYGSSYDCSQCCRLGRCCLGGNPAGPCT